MNIFIGENNLKDYVFLNRLLKNGYRKTTRNLFSLV